MAKQTAIPARPVRTTATRPATRQTASRQIPSRRPGATTRAKVRENIPARPFQMPFDQKNMRIIFAGIAVIVLGYLVMYLSPVMSALALTVSPIILLLGYCVIVPFGIMAGVHSNRMRAQAEEVSGEGLVSAEPMANGSPI